MNHTDTLSLTVPERRYELSDTFCFCPLCSVTGFTSGVRTMGLQCYQLRTWETDMRTIIIVALVCNICLLFGCRLEKVWMDWLKKKKFLRSQLTNWAFYYGSSLTTRCTQWQGFKHQVFSSQWVYISIGPLTYEQCQIKLILLWFSPDPYFYDVCQVLLISFVDCFPL